MPGSGGRARRPRALPKGDTLFTPDAAPTRQALEHRSATTLLWLHQLPRWLLVVLAGGLVYVGLSVTGLVAALALCGFAVMLSWLAAVSWPRLPVQGRLIRVAAIGGVLAVAVFRGLHL